MRLEDAETGRVVTRVVATRDAKGKVTKVSRKLYGVSGDGLKLKVHHKYRVVADYDNPTNETRIKGAMAHMVGLFVPDDMSQWPKIDPSDPAYQRDLASLQVGGETAEAMHHGGHGGHSGGARWITARWTMASCSTRAAGAPVASLAPSGAIHEGPATQSGRPFVDSPPLLRYGTIRRTPTHLVYHQRPYGSSALSVLT